jgi:hypothetical protein
MRRFFYGVLVGLGLGAVFAHYGERIVGAYSELDQIQLRLDDTNNTLTALQKRITDLEGKVNR